MTAPEPDRTPPSPSVPADPTSAQALVATAAAPDPRQPRRPWRQTANLIGEYLWLITRYQFITKLPFALVILPLYRWAVTWLIASTGQSALNSSNAISVLFTPQGFAMGVLTIAIALVATATDITAFILMEGTRLKTGALPTARHALLATLTTLRYYAHPSTLLLLLYLTLVVPLSGVGFSIDYFQWIAIPNFVSDVIANSVTYSIVYVVILGVLAIIGAYGTFLFHAIALTARNPWQAYRCSAAVFHQHLWKVVRVVGGALLLTALGVVVIFTSTMVIAVSFEASNLVVFWKRFWIFFWLFHVVTFLGVVSLYAPPLLLFRLTRLFVQHQPIHPATTSAHEPTNNETAISVASALPPPATKPATKPYRKLLACMAATSLVTAFIAAPASEQLSALPEHNAIPVIAHRGGGNLGPENTVPGLEAAIDAQIPWSEIDVQRTKDGGYIVTHDKTFARLSGNAATPQALTTAEATALPVANLAHPNGPVGHINTLEEMLVAAKGRIKLFVELKGASADQQMVDDVVALVNRHGMRDQVVIVGLNDSLIAYCESTYPSFETGFIYFFSVGNIATLPADYLIMEEGEVSTARVYEIHRAGKKVVVWTVNSVDNLAEISHLPLDGIITDIPVEIQSALTDATRTYDFERILDSLFIQR